MMDTIFSDRVYDAYDEYAQREEYERAFVFAIHDMIEQCQHHGFYAALCSVYTLCSDDDKRLMIKAISKILENHK